MADRRDERDQNRGERRDLERERRIERRADIYRGSDERGYGGGEHLGREWERGAGESAERPGRGEGIHSADEDRFSRGWGPREVPRDPGDHRFRDTGREVRQYSDFDRERGVHGYRDDVGRMGPERSPYGFGTRRFGEVIDREGRHRHYDLAGLHDLDDLSELRGRYHDHRTQPEYEPRYGHGPGVENMEPPRLGYGTSMSRRDNSDREMGHGGFLGATYRTGSPQPAGRGPKGYQRSDDRIREDICDRLMTSWMNAENVDVIVRAGEVSLQGTVKSRDEKRAIEALAESVLGVKDITNALRLERAEQEQQAKDSEQTSAPKPGDSTLHS